MQAKDTTQGVMFETRGGDGSTAYRWRHFPRNRLTREILLAEPWLPGRIARALVAPESLPRVWEEAGVTVIVLRVADMPATGEQGEVIPLRIAVSGTEIVTVDERRMTLIHRFMGAVQCDGAPASAEAFLLDLLGRIRGEGEQILDDLEERFAMLELNAAEDQGFLDAPERRELMAVRQLTLRTQRVVAHHVQTLQAILRLAPAWLHDTAALEEEEANRSRIHADLEALRIHGQLLADEVANGTAERLNRTMLTLSVVSVVFLPLTFLTGLLGVNLGGIPFAEDGNSFEIFTLFLGVVAIVSIWAARRMLR